MHMGWQDGPNFSVLFFICVLSIFPKVLTVIVCSLFRQAIFRIPSLPPTYKRQLNKYRRSDILVSRAPVRLRKLSP
jgi:hypothetical protein